MKTSTLLLAALLGGVLLLPAGADAGDSSEKTGSGGDELTVAVLETNHGRMVFRFFEDDAPKTSRQVQQLIRDGFYDGKRFYRVVAGHVIQAGDIEGESAPRVPGEFGRPHVVGTVGLARDQDPGSGTTEIYICLAPRPHLDGKYAAFGQVIEGLDVLEKIGQVEVDEKFLEGGVAFHSPKEAVVIERAYLEMRPGGESSSGEE